MILFAAILNILPATVSPEEMYGTVHTPLVSIDRVIPPAATDILRFYSMPNPDHKLLQVRDAFYKLIYRRDHELSEKWFPFDVEPLTVTEAHRLIEAMRRNWGPEEQRLRQLRGVLYRETKISSADFASFSTALAKGVMNFDPRNYDLTSDHSDSLARTALFVGFGLPGVATCIVVLRALNIL